MKLVVIGCGRVGAAVSRELAAEGWDVTAVDEKEEALARLGPRWAGGFIVGHGMDAEILRKAGVPRGRRGGRRDDGDNTNLVVGQVVQKRCGRPLRRRARARPRPRRLLRGARHAHDLSDADRDRGAHGRGSQGDQASAEVTG